MNVKLNLKALLTVVMLLVVVAAGAQTVEQLQYMRQFDRDAKVLYDRAKQYYDTEVAPVVKQLNAIPAERSEAEIAQMHNDLQVASDEYERLQYEEYAYSLRTPLEKLKTKLQLNGWKKLERGSLTLKQFDQEWNNSTYIQHLTSSGEEGIDALNNCVDKVTDLRLRYFDNCQQELEPVLRALAPAGDPSAFNIASVRRQMEEKAEIINTLTSALQGINHENEQYNELNKLRYQLVENWYDIHEDLDKKILEACRYTLSSPCDERGAFTWMRNQVEPKLDSVFHKSYRERRDRYRMLMANYDQHTAEIEDFLNVIFVYVKSGLMTEARKDEIASSLQSLDYYSYYYSHRNEERAVSSPYLDGIISDFETMLGNNFVDGVEKYSELIERLRGDQQYFAKLDEGTSFIAAEKRKREEEERKIESGEWQRFEVNGISFIMVKVQGGNFTMGATAEQGSDPSQRPPASKPASKPASSSRPASKPASRPAKPTSKPASKPASKPTSKPASKPASKPTTSQQKPAHNPSSDSDEKPVHNVKLSTYYICQTEVTQELWQAVMGSNPSEFKGAKRPVEQVSWDDCQEFIRKLNELIGMNFRLPTEAEWEYAARGGNCSQGYKYSGSNNLGDVAWYTDNSGSQTYDVATKQPNELGLFDMSGNVWEWCQDWYGENYYSSSPSSNPTGPASGSRRVLRGGGWGGGARNCRVAYRSRSGADCRGDNLGFRLAL